MRQIFPDVFYGKDTFYIKEDEIEILDSGDSGTFFPNISAQMFKTMVLPIEQPFHLVDVFDVQILEILFELLKKANVVNDWFVLFCERLHLP